MMQAQAQAQAQASPLLSLSPSSPSFNTYSSVNLAEIAARVVEEFRLQDSDSEFESWSHLQSDLLLNHDLNEDVLDEDGNNEDDDFEFAFVCREPDSSPISADEIFYNGQIRPIYPYPLFTSDFGGSSDSTAITATTSSKSPKSSFRSPLRKLLSEDREPSASSCSSSEADELDGVAPESYCVWTPKRTEADDQGRCKKSNSTGSSKRWKLRDLLHRSNSDGKETFVFLTPSKKNGAEEAKAAAIASERVKVNVKDHLYHVKSNCRRLNEGDKRRSFLPYRQDLVGLFSNVNGLSRNLHPF